MEGLRALQQRFLADVSSWVGTGALGQAPTAADGAPAPPAATAWLTRGRAGRQPVLPVRKPKPKSSSPAGSPPGSRRLLLRVGGRAGLQRLLRAALLLLVVASTAVACTAAAGAALYYRSIIHEPADALIAAAVEVQQAVRVAETAAVWPAGAPSLAAADELQPPGPAAIDVLRSQDDPPIEEAPKQLLTANYTGVHGGVPCGCWVSQLRLLHPGPKCSWRQVSLPAPALTSLALTVIPPCKRSGGDELRRPAAHAAAGREQDGQLPFRWVGSSWAKGRGCGRICLPKLLACLAAEGYGFAGLFGIG